MYLPRHFDAPDRAIALDLMRAHPLASLISNDADGLPFVTHLPLHVEERGDALILLGHCAKPNPHWRYLQERPAAVVTFMGPQAYMTPRVYPDLVRVPTWNYLAVHATVHATLVEDALAKDRLLKKLIRDHDPAYVAQWLALEPDYQHKMLAGIVAFELEVRSLQCKVKINQHRPEAHVRMRAQYAAGGENEQALGRWMDRLALARTVPGMPTEAGANDPDAQWMAMALAQAALAGAAGEVPVGAVVVRQGQLLAVGHNRPVAGHDPTAHAEIEALRAAAAALGNYRLDGCTLYVTLEPCAMCAGAMLHARLARVVFGAHDPKTGAAGSVLDLFAHAQLNHQTQVQGAVLSAPCGAVLRQFFSSKREEIRKMNQTLRDDALRTPEQRFDGLPGYPWQGRYLSDLPALDGLRMHYLDEGPRDARRTWLCLHGNPAWSYLYRKMIPVFLAAGDRVVAPDMPGFGKSDKPKKDASHSFSWHRQVLLEFVERLDLGNIALVVQDWGGLLGLTLPVAAPRRYTALLAMNTMLATGDAPLSPGFLAWREMCARNPEFDVARLFSRGNPHMSAQECAAYMAPYPDNGHRAALRAFAPMVPEFPDSDGAAVSREARDFWRTQWAGRSFMAVGVQDPVLGPSVMAALQQIVHGCPAPMRIEQAGHFVQEHGEAIARAALQAFDAQA